MSTSEKYSDNWDFYNNRPARMSTQTPQRIDKIPDREDLETEIRMLKALCEELRIDIESWQAEIVTLIARLPAPIARNLQARLDKSRAALKKAEKDI